MQRMVGIGLNFSVVIDAALGEILTTCSKMDWLIKHGERVLRPDSRYPNMMLLYKKSQVYYEPLGVVAALVSWNYRKLSSSYGTAAC
jgi:acyl-CoA reductase-like NAD-dependent aldehyde dehydrogenase